ncbi:MAG: indolepyruvate ferredoxin oxidoreductase family protein, partial [Pseudomonadota bacterium]
MDGADIGFDGDGATALRDVSLSDRFDLDKEAVLLSGTQALIRLLLTQSARDRAAGLDTAGYLTGYRGSPLGGVDLAAWRAKAALDAAGVTFDPALNEDLAATMIWGAQQAHLRGRADVDGVFALWYGKGPGVDRSGDVFRHANFAGVGPLGGVLVAMGDDHTAESSTTCHQSDLALIDAYMPVLYPAGPQEILDYGVIGYALSRFTGCWVGVKSLKDTVEATTVVDGRIDRRRIVTPEVARPPEGLNIVLGESVRRQEERLLEWRLPAVAPFARANGLDARRIGRPGARIGFAAAGKNWLDLVQALDLLGVDEREANRLGLSAYKIGLYWPLDIEGMRRFTDGLDLLMVVEEKRGLIETQTKEALYGAAHRPEIIGKETADGRPLFPVKLDINPLDIARAIAREVLARTPGEERLAARLAELEAQARAAEAPAIAERLPYFCSGCPHNSSTKLPEGARGAAGIGCHYMVQWMDRETVGFTQMGGEGAQWIGESRFSKDAHIFQNLGDGTYNHSGLMAVRAAVAAGVNITYKVLYNDAVAMTGGQPNEGGLTPYTIAEELLAAGIARLEVVIDPKETIDRARLPAVVDVHPRSDLDAVQRRLAAVEGVTAILYVQTCAAEKRRRRKRGDFPDLDLRVMINEHVCEGCGDCGRASNCVSILPKETELGRKRQIDQSSCNKDLSCVEGFCPSFVTVAGAKPKKRAAAELKIPDLPEPALPAVRRDGRASTAVLITGVGGTGVVTVGALLGMAAHLEGKGSGVMEMAGLAQKGGAVHIHCRIAETPEEVGAIRVQVGEADAVIGGDLVVTGGQKTLASMTPERARAVVNDHEGMTGEFTRDGAFTLPNARLRKAIRERAGAGELLLFDATRLAEAYLGDAIYANVLLLGAAWQRGLLPLSRAALRRAIELNGAGVSGNLSAFELGRWAAADLEAATAPIAAAERTAAQAAKLDGLTLDALIDRRAAFLRNYQDEAWAERFRASVARLRAAEEAVAPGSETLTRAGLEPLGGERLRVQHMQPRHLVFVLVAHQLEQRLEA